MKNYLLYGVDDYLIDEQIKKLLKDSSVISYDDTTNIAHILEEASMQSLFKEEKSIVIDPITLEYLNHETLLSYLKNPNPNTTLIFVIHTQKLDVKKKIIREVVSHLKVLECKKIVGFELTNYVLKAFKDEDYQIDKLTVGSLLNLTGDNLQAIMQEVEKLKLYKYNDRVITKEDIDNIVSKNSDDNIFKLVNMITSRNKSEIFEAYQDLMMMGEEPIKIIASLANQLRLIYQVKYYVQIENKSEEDIARILGIHPYRVKLSKEKIFDISGSELLNSIQKLADLDIKIKTGQIDKNLGLELFLLNI